MKNEELYDLIRAFAVEQTGAFEFEALKKYVQKKVKGFDDEDWLYDLAGGSDDLFEDEGALFSDRFTPRHVAFKGAEFRVTPLEEEIAAGYLIPGHRFMPFLSREVFPGEAVLKLPDGSAAPTRTVRMPIAEVRRFLLYFGKYGEGDYLICDSEENFERLQPPYDGDVSITVFDLQAFYEGCGFKPGDALMLTVEDWLAGVFSVRHVPTKQELVDFAETNRWVHALRLGFEEARLDAELDHDCYEQMARMLWLASENEDAPPVWSNPPLSLAAFFNMQKELTLKTEGSVSFFWPEDEPVDSRMMNSLMDGAEEPDSELEAFFSLLGISVNTEEAEAYMRDAMSCNEGNPDTVLARVISGRTLSFPTANEQQEFHQLWQELWDDVRQAHDPRNDPHREMRSVFLDLNDQCLAVLRQLDRDGASPFATMNHPASLRLGELSSLINSALVLFNQAAEEDAAEFPMPLEEMARGMSAAIGGLSEQLLSGDLSSSAGSSAGPIYQLKISLKHSSPPIWRRVLVPASIELEDLHAVIQTVFGWTNSHLHQFVDGRTFYQPGGEDEGFPSMSVVDSVGVPLQSLLRKEKDKVVYEYDFGDSWEHQVLLEKVLPVDPEQRLPVCIKGKRACPPDDCGGIPGYFQILETLEGPNGEEKSALFEWLGGPFDPEAFDLDEINTQLHAWF